MRSKTSGARFDGERRNPWDEPECGHHYARAMSAWSPLVALSGFGFLAVDGAVTVRPRTTAGRIPLVLVHRIRLGNVLVRN